MPQFTQIAVAINLFCVYFVSLWHHRIQLKGSGWSVGRTKCGAVRDYTGCIMYANTRVQIIFYKSQTDSWRDIFYVIAASSCRIPCHKSSHITLLIITCHATGNVLIISGQLHAPGTASRQLLGTRRHFFPSGAALRHVCLNCHWRDTDLILRLHFISFLPMRF